MWKFKPIFKETIWGGSQILKFKDCTSVDRKIGESWEISDLKGSETCVSDGEDRGLSISDLIAKYGNKVMGERISSRFTDRFPLLVKFIGAQDDLSVQVHPDDNMALRENLDFGKNEFWYIINAEKDAKLACGFNKELDRDEFTSLLDKGEITSRLNYITPQSGDAFYIPAGRVHTIGKGILLVEIQQSADVTYRIYDYDRLDIEGNKRELHTDKALQTINFRDTDGRKVDYHYREGIPVNLVHTPYFTVNVFHLTDMTVRDYREFDTFVILVAISGSAVFESGGKRIEVRMGDTILIPASAQGVAITPSDNFSAIETYIK